MKSVKSIFVVDGDEVYAKEVITFLKKHFVDFEFKHFFNHKGLLGNLHLKPDLIILEHKLSKDVKHPYNGKYVLNKLETMKLNIPVIILSSLKDPKTIVQLLKQNIVDYVIKDKEAFETLLSSINNVFSIRKIKHKVTRNKEKIYRTKIELAVVLGFITVIVLLIYFG